MIRATARSTATPDRLWSMASDVEHWADRLPTVTAIRPLGAGPIGVGSKFEVRQPGLPKAVWEVTEWQQQARSFTWVSSSLGIGSTATHTVHGDDGGSRLDLSLEWSGPLARVMEVLVGRKATGMVEIEAETFTRLAGQD
jgi:Polyketide cyclase / dehydrase and lipid transport